MKNLRQEFPFFRENHEIIYLDSASTTQKPISVIKAINNYHKKAANAGRGIYTLANQITKDIEDVRSKVASFINAAPKEIIFTSGSTSSINTITYSWALYNLKNDDEILVCFEDHESNVLPWLNIQDILKPRHIKIKVVPFKITSSGDADIEDIISKITSKTRLISLTHIHNVYGTKTDVEVLRSKIDKNILLSLDASQSIGHIPVDVKSLGVDFLSFSGHKMFASTGVGVLWINKRIHNKIHPFLVGGQTGSVLPTMLEAGTQNVSGIVSLGAAIDFINKISVEYVEERMLFLSQYLLGKLRAIEEVDFLPGIAYCRCAVGYGVISFNINGIDSSDVGFILNNKGIYVRTGTHCTAKENADNRSVRVSLHVYNTEQEIDYLINSLKEITHD